MVKKDSPSKQRSNKTSESKQGAIFKGLVKTAIDAIITINEKGEIETFNPAAEKLFQYKASEVLGKNIKTLMPTKYAKEHDGYLQHYLETGKRKIIGIGREVEAKRRDNSTVPIHLSISEAKVKNRLIFVGIARDISKMKAQEIALQENQMRLQSMLDTAVDGVITIDNQGRIQSFNPAAEKLFGYTVNEVLDQNVKILMPEPFTTQHDQYLKNYLTTGKKKIIGIGREVEAKRKDGNVLPIHLSISEFTVSNERFFTGIVRDISELKSTLLQLKSSEEKSRAIIDMAVDAIITIDEMAKIQMINPAASKLFGYQPKEVCGKNINIFMPSPYHEQHDSYINNYLTTGKQKIIGIGRRVVAQQKNGDTFPIHLSVSEFKVGEKRYFAGIIHDISNIVKAEEQLAKSNEKFKSHIWLQEGLVKLHEQTRNESNLKNLSQTIIDFLTTYMNIAVGVFYLAENQKLHFVAGHAYSQNEDSCKQLTFGQGISGHAALSKKIQFLHPNNQTTLLITSSISTTIPAEIVAIPLIIDDHVVGVIELGALQMFTDTQKLFLDNVIEAIAILIHSSRAQNRVQDLLKETQKQAKKLESQQDILQNSNEALAVKTRQLESQQRELELSNKELSKQRTLLENQRAELISANKALEVSQRELDQKAQALELSSRYKSEFLANMSHELRTPLNSIIIMAQLLAENNDSRLSEKQVDSVKTIYSSGKDLLNLISDILDLSKVEAGKLEVNFENVDLNKEMEVIFKMFEASMQEKGLDFSVAFANNLPHEIVTDKLRLGQIIKNLVSNALKYTERGFVKILIDRPQQIINDLPISHAIAINVIDTGIGIAHDKHQQIFEEFKQLDSGLNRKYTGTGLGLSVSTKLAALLCGAISLDSKPDEGSTFTLILPEDGTVKQTHNHSTFITENTESNHDLSTVHQQNVSDILKPDIGHIEDDRDNSTTSDTRILIIEDDLHFAELLKDQCHSFNFKVIHECDGESGFHAAQLFKPNGIILDIRLPMTSGLTVLKKLKLDPKLRNIPVQIISVDSKENEVLKLGAIGFLQKPIEKDALNNALTHLAEVQKTEIRNVLLLDDNQTSQQDVNHLLENNHINMHCVRTPTQALKKLQNQSIDCIILNVKLRDQGGFKFLETLKKESTSIQPPIIIYATDNLTNAEHEQLTNYDSGNLILIKDIDSPEKLLNKVLLFLHKVETDISGQQRQLLKKLGESENIYSDKSILIVDGDMRNVFSMRAILDDLGCKIMVATSGLKALETLNTHPDIDMVLMDIVMPEMNGIETIKQIRTQAIFSQLPIIALTANSMENDYEQCLAIGATDYLSKPIDLSQLLSLLKIWLSNE